MTRALLSGYEALRVRPYINCAGMRTVHGGSRTLPQVLDAMRAAATEHVDLDELMATAGRRIAELLGADDAIVTAGSAAALALATAACLAGNDPIRMMALPQTENLRNTVLIASDQRFAYDHSVRAAGGRIIEVASLAETNRALEGGVAMAVAVGAAAGRSAIAFQQLAAWARANRVPLIVDAASGQPTRPDPWLEGGADLVIYSAGKFLQGPQSTGFLAGRSDLVQAAWRHCSPHQAFGRTMKTSKEEIVGAVAALEYWFGERDAQVLSRRWMEDLATIARCLDGIEGVTSEVSSDDGLTNVPILKVSWDETLTPIDSEAVRSLLLAGEPRVLVDDLSCSGSSLAIDPFNLAPHEAAKAGVALARILTPPSVRADGAVRRRLEARAQDVSGVWTCELEFLRGRREMSIRVTQSSGLLAGTAATEGHNGTVSGSIAGRELELSCLFRLHGANLHYRLSGFVTDQGTASGRLVLGRTSDKYAGRTNLAQFGGGSWTGRIDRP